MNFGIGSFGVSAYDGMVSPVYFVLRPLRAKETLRYYRHLFNTTGFRLFSQMLGSGILEHRAAIPWDEFKTIGLPVPCDDEQAAIASYLDQETSRIDTLISKKEQLIEKLLERRQALITQVVTKGLDPNVPMKDSGVEWLGEVPEDWELKRVAHVSRRTKIPASGLGIVTAFRDGQVTLRSNRRTAGFTEATEFHGYQRIRKGQVAVHKMDGFAGAIGVSDSDGMCSPVLTLLDCASGLRPDYLALTLREISKTGWIEALAKGVRERTTEFGWSDLSWQVVPLPDIRQQEEIITYLDQETSQMDTLVEKTRRAIELLKERRQALITQFVTGKIDVRGFAGGNS
jgi:type I restriction enzyme S subunit